MRKRILFIVLGMLFVSSTVLAQQAITPSLKQWLDFYYISGAGNGVGTDDIVDGAVTFPKIGFFVVTNELDPLWVASSNFYYLKVQADALFLTAEVDPLWVASSNKYYLTNVAVALFATGTPVYVETDPVFTNLQGISVNHTQVLSGVTHRWTYVQGVLTNLTTNWGKAF